MSNDALTWAWKARIPDGPKFVLVALADHASDHAGEDWTCFPSVERLMERTSKSRSTVERGLKWLDENGWISRRRRRRGDGTLGIYDFTLHRDKRSAVTPIEGVTGPQDGVGHTSDCRVDHTSKDPATTRQNSVQPHVNLTQQEPSLEPSGEPSQGARASEAAGEKGDFGEPGSDGVAEVERWVTEAIAAWPDSGRSATKFAPCVEVWSEQAGLAGGSEGLLGCIRAFSADPYVKRRTHGAGGLQRWLKDGGWRAYVGVVAEAGEASAAVPGGRFVGPPEVRAVAVEALGENNTRSYLDPAAWQADGRRLTPKFHVAYEQLKRLDWGCVNVTLVDPRGQ
jgi:hypothetical protein